MSNCGNSFDSKYSAFILSKKESVFTSASKKSSIFEKFDEITSSLIVNRCLIFLKNLISE